MYECFFYSEISAICWL